MRIEQLLDTYPGATIVSVNRMTALSKEMINRDSRLKDIYGRLYFHVESDFTVACRCTESIQVCHIMFKLHNELNHQL